jgi:hypothetical protein
MAKGAPHSCAAQLFFTFLLLRTVLSGDEFLFQLFADQALRAFSER